VIAVYGEFDLVPCFTILKFVYVSSPVVKFRLAGYNGIHLDIAVFVSVVFFFCQHRIICRYACVLRWLK